MALPGTVLACTDSHTCAGGAMNTAARGLGPAEILQMGRTGKCWYRVPRTLRSELVRGKPPHVNRKAIFLHIANRYGDAPAHAVEFGGPGLASVPLADRRTLAT